MKNNTSLLLVMLLAFFLNACSGGGKTSADGNNADVNANPAGSDNKTPDTDRPSMAGAISKSNTSILVTFNEAMGESAADPSNYSIVTENVNSEAGGLSILSATLSEDKTSVVLVTTSQGALTYRVIAVGVKDLAGNVIAQKATGIGSDVDPASAVIAGTAPSLVQVTVISGPNGIDGWKDLNENGKLDAGDGFTDAQGNAFLLADVDGDGVIDNWVDEDGNQVVSAGDLISGLLDSDLDGVLDSVENQGWTVTVTQVDGTTTKKQVTSDPFKADTDGDKLSDFEEFTNNADPRNADTDGDQISDYLEWNVVFSDLSDRDTDKDGIPDQSEYTYYFTSPILADTDGDGISDADEIDNNRNPRIADRPDYSIKVKTVNLTLIEDYTYTSESGSEAHVDSTSTVSLSKDESIETTDTDAGVSETVGQVEAQLEAGYDATQQQTTATPVKAITTVGGGQSWTDSTSWQTDVTSAKSSSETYENSLTKGSSLTKTDSYTRNVTGASIALNVDVLNQSNFTLTFSDIKISVLKRKGGELLPIATLSLPDGFGDLEISPLNNDSKGKDVVFENKDMPANVVEDLMKNVPGLVFKVVNYSVKDNDGRSFASTDQGVFNRAAGIVFDFEDNANAKRYLVTTAGSNDIDKYVGGGWQGGVDGEGHARGVSLDYAMQDIIGMTRHYRYDTIEAGSNGVLDTVVKSESDDLLEGNRILPGSNGWIDTQPAGDDELKSAIHDHTGKPTVAEQGIIAGPDRFSNSIALGDDVQEVPLFTVGIPYGTVVVSAGPNKVLDSVAGSGDLVEYVGGYETSRTCVGNITTVGAICKLDEDCNTDKESNGACTGPERIARINTLRTGDFNRDWFVFLSESLPTSAEFSKIVIKPGQIFRLAFLQDLDRDGLTLRTENLNGSVDSSANLLDNSKFGIAYDLTAGLANGPGADLFADSRDTDHDGLSDYAEVKVGWKINNPDGSLTQVFPHPGLADSDGDGLEDMQEMDLRNYCAVKANEWRFDGLCAFLNTPAVLQKNATAIIAGKNGKANSVVSGDDVEVVASGTAGLQYGTVVILAGDNGKIDSTLGGDDVYENGSSNIPSTHPRLKDTDNDKVDDYNEVVGYSTGDVVVDGGNGIAETDAAGDDMALVMKGVSLRPGGVMITTGIDGVLDTVPVTRTLVFGTGDDFVDFFGNLICGDNMRLDTIPLGGDVPAVSFGSNCTFLTNVGIYAAIGQSLNTKPNLIRIDNPGSTGDDKIRYGTVVRTDPLRADSDGDGAIDGIESLLGTNPTVVDSPDYLDQDNDGLTDYVENTGWNITINGTQYLVKSNPLVADSDGDGLPDLVERDTRSSPVNIPNSGIDGKDSDGDGLSDYQEFTNFVKYATYPAQFSGFELINDNGTHYTTSATKADSDGDGLSDYDELMTYGTNPSKGDTDGDTLSDYVEINEPWSVVLLNGGSRSVHSDPLKVDADGDGLNDAQEKSYKTDPENANTDNDVYKVSDKTEIALGTNPLDAADRCVTAKFESYTLNQGVASYDTDGYVRGSGWADLQTQFSVSKIAGTDISYTVGETSMNVGNTKNIAGASRKMLMQSGDKVYYSATMAFKDYGIASWTDSQTQGQTINASEFDKVTVTRLAREHVFSQGYIKITTNSSATLILDPALGNCK